MSRIKMLLSLMVIILYGCGQQGQILEIGSKYPSKKNKWKVKVDKSGIKSICAIDSVHFILASGEGSIFTSGDGGKNWKIVKKGSRDDIGSFRMGNSLWAIERPYLSVNTIVKSLDSGLTWKPCISQAVYINALLVKGTKIYAATASGNIISSENDGNTWSAKNYSKEGFYSLISDAAGKNFWAVGHTLLHSGDSGKTWNDISYTHGLENKSFMYGYVDSSGNDVWVCDGTGNIFFSGTCGRDWKKVAVLGSYIKSFAGDGGSKNLWIVSDNNIFVSVNGGVDWHATGIKNMTDILCNFSARKLWAFNASSLAFSSKDLREANWVDTNLGDTETQYIAMVDTDRIWAVANNTNICLSRDGGEHWQTIYTNNNLSFSKIFTYKNGTNIYVAANKGMIAQSRDSGTSWQVFNTGYSKNISAIAINKNSEVYAIGDSGLVVSQTNNNKWTGSYPLGKEVSLNDIVFANNKFWIATNSGILLSGNGKEKWQQVSLKNASSIVRVIYVPYKNSLIIAGNDKDSNPLLFIYNLSSGETSKINTGGLYQINDLVLAINKFENKLWLLTEDPNYESYMLSYSADGGENWTTETISSGDNIYSDAEGQQIYLIDGATLIATDGCPLYASVNDVILIPFGNNVRLKLHLSKYPPGTNIIADQPSFKLSIADAKTGLFQDQNINFELSKEDSLTYSCVFHPANLRLSQGDPYFVKIILNQSDFTESYILPKKFIYQAWKWLDDNKWVYVLVALLSYNLIIIGFWIFSPLSILRIHQRIPFDKLIGIMPSPFKDVFSVFFILFPFSVLAESKKVLNAWSRKNCKTINQIFKHIPTVQLRANYVPIPVYNELSNVTINEPSPEIAHEISFRGRSIIQIIGDGGSGKTTFAIKLANWIVEKREETKLYTSCILIDVDTTDLPGLITSRLTAWLPNEKITKDLVKALLKNQNIICIIDALSEKSQNTQEYINGIFGEFQINLLLITARYRFTFNEQRFILFKPVYLSLDKLIFFISTYIVNKSEEVNLRYGNQPFPVRTFDHHLMFAKKIGDLFKNTHTITPILVTLVIDNFFENYYEKNITDFEELLTLMPENIPGVYIQYLKNVNPKNENVANYLPEEDMIAIAKYLGFLSIRKTYTPHNIPKLAIQQILRRKYPDYKDPFQRIIDNQIMTKMEDLGFVEARFNLDPCSEYLGALYITEKMDIEKIVQFYVDTISLLPETNGFKKAFSEIISLKKIILPTLAGINSI